MFFEEEEGTGDFNQWWDNLPEEEKSKLKQEHRKSWERMKQHPLQKKSREILELVTGIIEAMPEDQREMHMPILESALLLPPKFAGAYGTDMWVLAMQNAAIMRYHAQYIASGTYGFNMVKKDLVDERYIVMLRNEMENYRKLFKDWMDEVHALPKDPVMDDDDWGVFVRA